MDYHQIKLMLEMPPVKLLRAQNAPLLLSFLHRVFKQEHRVAIPEGQLRAALEAELEERREAEPLAYPQPAADYLTLWCGDSQGFLRRYYGPGADEPLYELTSGSEKALLWLYWLLGPPHPRLNGRARREGRSAAFGLRVSSSRRRGSLDRCTQIGYARTLSESTASGDPFARDPSTILFGRTWRRVLAWLFGHPEERFYLRRIVRESGAAHGAVQRELQKLNQAGILRRTVEGRHVFFQANRESPIFPELHMLLLKTAGIVDVVRDALAPLADRVRVAFVFGSAARGELRSDSDVDVLVVGDVLLPAVAHAFASAHARLGRDVNPTLYPPAEFRRKLRAGHHFLTTLLQEPLLFAVGGPDVLAGLGAERVSPRPQVRLVNSASDHLSQLTRASASAWRGSTRPAAEVLP